VGKGRVRFAAALVACLLLPFGVYLGTQGTHAAFTGGLNNTVNKFGSGTAYLTAKDTSSAGATECTSQPAGSSVPATAAWACSGATLPGNAAIAAGGTAASAKTYIAAGGTSNYTGVSMRANSCYPEKFTNSLTGNDLLVRGGINYRTAGPYGTASAAGFNGSDTSGIGTISAAGLQAYSLSVWFKTSTQGAILGWGSSATTSTPATYDRLLYVDNNGLLNWGTYVSGYQVIVSGTSVADGAWHLATVTAQPGATTSTTNLYIDGNLAGSKSINATSTSEGGNGYWRVGWSNVSGWNSSITNNYFNGSLAGFAVYPTVLSADNITALQGAGSDAGYVATAQGLGANQFWGLNDNGTAVYTGTLPGGAANPCAHVRITASYSNGCIYPNSTGTTACASLSSSYTVAGMVAAGALPLYPSSTTQILTVNMTRDSTFVANFDAGLRLVIPTTLTTGGWVQAFNWSSNEVVI
jgi:hypothetical protein